MKKLSIAVSLMFVLWGVIFAQAQQEERIAVAALGRTENSEIGQQAGRAPYFLIFDNSGKLLEVISNPTFGPQVASLFDDKNITKVISEHFGPGLITALDERGIKYSEATGTVKDAVQKLMK